LGQPTCCAACSALRVTSETLATIERKAKWLLRMECTAIAAGYSFAMVTMLMTCFPGRLPITSTLKDKVSYASTVQLKVGGWQAHYELSKMQK
jgi:hypothetical protein